MPETKTLLSKAAVLEEMAEHPGSEGTYGLECGRADRCEV